MAQVMCWLRCAKEQSCEVANIIIIGISEVIIAGCTLFINAAKLLVANGS